MHTILQRLVLDHKRLKILLGMLEQQIAGLSSGNEHDLDLLCELIQYIGSYEDQVHHPAENLIFNRFKGVSDTGDFDVSLLERQHHELSHAIKRFYSDLEGIIQGEVISRQEIAIQGHNLLRMLRAHVELEEQKAFLIIDARLTDTDWQALEIEIQRIDDPVFEQPDLARFRTLLRYLT